MRTRVYLGILILLAFVALLSLPAHAQFTTITMTNVENGDGLPLALGTTCWTGTNNAGTPIAYRAGASGQTVTTPVCRDIISGAVATTYKGVAKGALQVADTTLTQPANVCYKVTVTDTATGKVVLGSFGGQKSGYDCVQPSGTTWSFDTFVPNTTPNVVQTTGPAGPQGPPGLALNATSNITFTGNNVFTGTNDFTANCLKVSWFTDTRCFSDIPTALAATLTGHEVWDTWRTSTYTGAGFVVPPGITLKLAPITYQPSTEASYNNGTYTVNCPAIVRTGAGLIGASSSYLNGTLIQAKPSFTTGDGVVCSDTIGMGAINTYWHFGKIQDLAIDANKAGGATLPGLHVENMGEVSVLRNLFVFNSSADNVWVVGGCANCAGIENITSDFAGRYNYNFDSIRGTLGAKGLSGDGAGTAWLRTSIKASGSLQLNALKIEANNLATQNDPTFLIEEAATGQIGKLSIDGATALRTAGAGADFIKLASGNVMFKGKGIYAESLTNAFNDVTNGKTFPLSALNDGSFAYNSNGTPVPFSSPVQLPNGVAYQGTTTTGSACTMLAADGANATQLKACGSGGIKFNTSGSVQIGQFDGSGNFFFGGNTSFANWGKLTGAFTGQRSFAFPDQSGTVPVLEQPSLAFSSGDASLIHNLNSGATAGQLAILGFQDRGATKWLFQKTAGNNFQVLDSATSGLVRWQLQPGDVTLLNSGGATPVRFNSTANSGTGGAEFYSGGASPAKVASVDATGKGIFNGGAQIGTNGTALAAVITASATLTYTAIAAQTCQEQPITVTNSLVANKGVKASPQAEIGANLMYGGARVSAAGTVQVRVCNPTAVSTTPTAVTWGVTVTQ